MRNTLKWMALTTALLLTASSFATRSLAAEKTAATAYEARKSEILAVWAKAKPRFPAGESPYATAPSIQSPYKAGSLKPTFVEDGLKTLNFARFLAGLPDDVAADEALNKEGPHCAVLLAALNRLDHSPSKPTDMDASFYAVGKKAAGDSNLGVGRGQTTDGAVRMFMDDSDAFNIEMLGHRRWVLHPRMKRVGFGHATSTKGVSYVPMLAHDASRKEKVDYNAICWPNGPAFPSDFFADDMAWSVTLDPERYQTPQAASITITLTESATGKTWKFSKATKDKAGNYFNVNTEGYGVGNCIVFRPDGVSSYDGTYKVSISGLKKKDGKASTLSYSVRFFALD